MSKVELTKPLGDSPKFPLTFKLIPCMILYFITFDENIKVVEVTW